MNSQAHTNIYSVKVRGHLDERRVKTLGDLSMTHTSSGETVLVGHLQDQAALFGLLNRLRDLGIPLLAVNLVDDHPTAVLQAENAEPASS